MASFKYLLDILNFKLFYSIDYVYCIVFNYHVKDNWIFVIILRPQKNQTPIRNIN